MVVCPFFGRRRCKRTTSPERGNMSIGNVHSFYRRVSVVVWYSIHGSLGRTAQMFADSPFFLVFPQASNISRVSKIYQRVLPLRARIMAEPRSSGESVVFIDGFCGNGTKALCKSVKKYISKICDLYVFHALPILHLD